MLDFVVELVVASPWTYLAIFMVVVVDAFFPVVPSETVVITAGVVAATGDLLLPLVIVVAALGAVAGDNLSYLLGRTAGPTVQKRFFSGEAAGRRLGWAKRQLHLHGGSLIIMSRFVPGGRTATTFTSGLLHMHWPRFVSFDVAAGLLWAGFAAGLGAIGGAAFEDEPTKALLLAFAAAVAIAGLAELVRRVSPLRLTPKPTH